jgi:hypothetical protein
VLGAAEAVLLELNVVDFLALNKDEPPNQLVQPVSVAQQTTNMNRETNRTLHLGLSRPSGNAAHASSLVANKRSHQNKSTRAKSPHKPKSRNEAILTACAIYGLPLPEESSSCWKAFVCGLGMVVWNPAYQAETPATESADVVAGNELLTSTAGIGPSCAN